MASTSTNKLGKPLRDNIQKTRLMGQVGKDWNACGPYKRGSLYWALFSTLYSGVFTAIYSRLLDRDRWGPL